MSDRDPLAAIEALADGWARSYPSLVIGPQLRTALAEAREEVEGLVAERDRLREALGQVEALAKLQATSLQAAHRADMERNWLDVLAIIERTALAQPATDEEADQ